MVCDANQNCKTNMATHNPTGKKEGLATKPERNPSFSALLAPRISHGNVFLAVFFRIPHDRLNITKRDYL